MFLTNPPSLSSSNLKALSFKPRTACAPDTLARDKKPKAFCVFSQVVLNERSIVGRAPRSAERTMPTRALPGPRARAIASGKVAHAVVMLDLDKTSLYGNDGNDLPLSLQWQDTPHAVVAELYKLLVSPNIRPALEQVHAQADDVTVVIYTRRPQVVHYTSPYRQESVHMLFNPAWHDARGQLLLPGHVETAADMMEEYTGVALLQEERRDVEKILERLLGARDAVASELGLAYTPTIVVTGTAKVVEGTAAALGLPGEHAVLFDDNPELARDAKVVTVEPLTSLPEHQRQRVLDFMQPHLPAEQLSEDLRAFLLGASPAECSVRNNKASGALEWHVPGPATPLKLWGNPALRSELRAPTREALPQGHAIPDWGAQARRARAHEGKGSSLSLCAAA
jgi:hypothetical protein